MHQSNTLCPKVSLCTSYVWPHPGCIGSEQGGGGKSNLPQTVRALPLEFLLEILLNCVTPSGGKNEEHMSGLA